MQPVADEHLLSSAAKSVLQAVRTYGHRHGADTTAQLVGIAEEREREIEREKEADREREVEREFPTALPQEEANWRWAGALSLQSASRAFEIKAEARCPAQAHVRTIAGRCDFSYQRLIVRQAMQTVLVSSVDVHHIWRSLTQQGVMQVHPLQHGCDRLDGRAEPSIGATLQWSTEAHVTANFCNSLLASPVDTDASLVDTDASADHVRFPGFLLFCLDGSTLLLSEREAHFVLTAMHDACRAEGATAMNTAPRTAVVQLSFARAALPRATSEQHVALDAGGILREWTEAQALSASLCVVSAQLFAGETAYQRLPGSRATQDEKRMELLRHVLLDGVHGVEGVRVRQSAVQQLLVCRKRSKHYLDSDLDEVLRADAARARAEQLQKSEEG